MGHIHRMTAAPGHLLAVRLHAGPQSLRAKLGSGLLPRTIRLCVRCCQNPAGFWVSRDNGGVTHRPWCLSCTDRLDGDRYTITPFGG